MDPEPGEQVFFHGHPSWRSMLDFYLKGLVVAVIAGAMVGIATRVGSHQVDIGLVIVAVLVVYLLVLVVGLITRIRTTYTISSRRLTIDCGLLSRDLQETRLDRVQNVNYTQTMLERMLRIGTVDFDTAAGAEYDFKFRGVADPHSIVRTVDRAQQQISGSPRP
ncbi:MAG: PH domain-containing protein [Actinomycetota bacterium]|nr:PH domain-containing protein [Actinomycetota bacterium]